MQDLITKSIAVECVEIMGQLNDNCLSEGIN